MKRQKAAEWVKLEALQPWNKNPRDNDAAAEQLAKTLARFGVANWGAPIVARRADSMIIAGHTRVKAARLLDWDEVPVRFVDVSEAEAKAMALADNRLGELAEWSDDLGDVLQELDALSIDLDSLGWTPDELEELLSLPDLFDDDLGDDADLDAVPVEVEALTRPGEVVTLGRHTLHCGDCIDVMAGMADSSVDAIVTDPPYGIGFMSGSIDWDCEVPGDEFAAQAFRVLKPGGHLIAFAACRTVHRLMVNVEDAAFEIRDIISWLQWQGFPKSLNLGGGIGTALKPAQEPAVLARKPLEGTVAANVLKWGTGGLNIDACRIPYGDISWPGPSTEPEWSGAQGFRDKFVGGSVSTLSSWAASGAGRWPANIYHCPKPSRSEREKGCDELPGGNPAVEHAGKESKGLRSPRAGTGRTAGILGNHHPTVKPVNLMRWLVRLVTPKDGVILEPFCGSGTTLIAAEAEGFRCVAVERDAGYCDIIRARHGAIVNG